MSLILDALRGGSPRAAPRPSSNAAQTDAVLQTLGYGRFNATSPFNRIKRILGSLAVAVVIAIVIWAAVTWVTTQYFPHDTPMEGPKHPQLKSVAPPAATLATPSPPVTLESTPVVAPPPSPVGRSAGSGEPIVQNSRRPDVPLDLPRPATGTLVSEVDHFQLALYYQRSGDFENALGHYRAVLQRDELNAEAHNNLGLLFRGKGLYDEAVNEFVRAIAINQRYVKAHSNLGVTYLSQRRNDAAASEFRTALAIDPRNVESLVNLSLAEKDAGSREDASASLERALKIDPRSAEAHYNFALMADETGDKAAALTHYRAFLQYANDHPDLVPQVRARVDALSR